MQFSFDSPQPLDYFQSLVQSDDHLPLLEAAICLAHDEYPKLDVQSVLSEVDGLIARLKRRIPADEAALGKLRLLTHFFYKDLGFRGNVNDYYEPENSFISSVLRTRAGIPISLAVLWLELAQAIGLKAQGVSFPGHFLVKVSLPAGLAVLDPMSGESFSREALEEMLAPFRLRSGLRDHQETPLTLYLQSAPARDILVRMLRNLKEIYQQQGDWNRALAVQERMVVLLPAVWSEYRDRGLIHARLGHNDQALADLECYMVHAQDVLDIDTIADRIETLRRPLG